MTVVWPCLTLPLLLKSPTPTPLRSPLERARIEQAGGWVTQALLDEEGRPAGPHRVYLPGSNIPGLAVSRCFGDAVAAAAGVTSTPDITTLLLPTGDPDGGGRAASAHRRRTQQGPSGSRQAQQQAQQARQQQPARVPSQGRSRRPQRGAPPAARERQQQPAGWQREQARQRQRAGSRPGVSEARHVLIVASDGLWEFVSNAEAVRLASR